MPIVASQLSPALPIGGNCVDHLPGRIIKQSRRPLSQVSDDVTSFQSSQVNVGRLVTHGLEQLDLVTFYGKGGQFNARAIRRQTPHDPASAQPHPRVGASYRLIEDLLIQNPIRDFAALCEDARRRDQRLSLPRYLSATPHSDADVTLSAKTAEAGDTMHDYMRHIGLGQHSSNSPPGAAGDPALDRRQTAQ